MYIRALENDPRKITSRTLLIRTLVVDFDSPAKAKEYLTYDAEKTWHAHVPAACRPVSSLKEQECKKLGDWYYRDLAEKTEPFIRYRLLSRARAYYQRFAKLHTKKDAQFVKVKMVLAQVEAELRNADEASGGPRKVIDLLKLVDPKKHRVSGTWMKMQGRLSVARSSAARLTVPIVPEGSYELKVVFERQGGRQVVIMLPVGSGVTAFHVGYTADPSLRMVGGSSFYGYRSKVGRLVNGKEYTIIAKVTVGKKRSTISVYVNGDRGVEWKGDPATLCLSTGCDMPDKGALGLGADLATVVFKEAKLRMTTGQAKPLTKRPNPEQKAENEKTNTAKKLHDRGK